MSTRSRAATAALLLLVACGDSTGPVGPPGAIDPDHIPAVSAVVTGTSVGEIESRPPSIECTVTLTASLHARAPHAAEPRQAVFRFHLPGAPTPPLDSMTVGASDLAQAFGALEPGDEVPSGWVFRAGVPFAVTGHVRWSQGELVESPFAFDCGPAPDEENPAPPPSATILSITPSGDVEAGTRLTVDYEAGASVGLWETWVILSGPQGADTIRTTESLRESTRRQVEFGFPRGSLVGSRLSVRVVAVDGTLRGAISSPVLTGAYVDTRPPRDARFSFLFPDQACTPVLCQFASDSALRFYASAYDVGGLGWARVAFGDPVVHRDSLWMGDVTTSWLQLGTPGGLSGVYPVRASIVDVAGNAVDFDLGEANVYPAVGGSVTRELSLSGLSFVAPDFAAGRLYVVPASGIDPMGVYDIETLALLDEVPLPAGAVGIDVAPGGERLLVLLPGSRQVALLTPDGSSVRAFEARQPQPLPPLQAGGAVFTSTGSVVVVLNDNRGTSSAVVIDPATGEQTTLIDGVGAGSHDRMFVSRSGDGRRVALTLLSGCGRIYDAVDGTLSECAEVATPLIGDQTGDRWVSPGVVYGANLERLVGISAAGRVSTAAPAGIGIVYAASLYGLLRLDTETGLILEKRPAEEYVSGGFTSSTMAVSPDGSRAVISGKAYSRINENHTLITVVDLD